MIPKFRAWDKEEQKFADWPVYFNLTNSEIVTELWYGYEIQVEEALQDSNYIVQQSTGLFDKNGTVIYEGDIVQDEEGDIAYIVFLKKDMGYFIVYKSSDRRLEEVDDYNFEILGNIYQHPHLLEEE